MFEMVKNKFKVSQHAKERILERTDLSRGKDANSLFRNAIHSGKSPSQFSPPFSTYLKQKLKRGNQVKVYAGLIFIYSNKTLITAYRIPPKFKDFLNRTEQIKSVNKLASSMSNKELIKSLADISKKWQRIAILSKSGKFYYNNGMHAELVYLGSKTRVFAKLLCDRYQVDCKKLNIKIHYCVIDAYFNYVSTEISKLNAKSMDLSNLAYIISVLNALMKYVDKHNQLLNSKSV